MLDFFAPHAPDGPGTPFGHGVLVLDLLRCLILALCAVMVISTVAGVAHSRSLPQKIRLTSTALLALVIAGTEFDHLGDYAHWRLPVSLIAVGLGTWGMIAYLVYETPGAGERQAERDRRRGRRRTR